MPGNQTNVEYWFRLIYEWFYGQNATLSFEGFKALMAHIWLWIIAIGYMLSIIGIFFISAAMPLSDCIGIFSPLAYADPLLPFIPFLAIGPSRHLVPVRCGLFPHHALQCSLEKAHESLLRRLARGLAPVHVGFMQRDSLAESGHAPRTVD